MVKCINCEEEFEESIWISVGCISITEFLDQFEEIECLDCGKVNPSDEIYCQLNEKEKNNQLDTILHPNLLTEKCLGKSKNSNVDKKQVQEKEICVIQCNQNKFYILNHSLSSINEIPSNEFTKKYKPIKILEKIISSDPLDEDKITKKYMLEYGIDNVRGGSYKNIILEDWQIKSLENEIKFFKSNTSKVELFDIKTYIKKFNDITEIDVELQNSENLYKEVVALQNLINRISILDINLNCKKPYKEKINLQLLDTLQKLELQQLESELQGLKIHIRNLFENVFRGQSYINDTSIQVLKLINLRLESQKKLDLLLNEFKTIETLEKIIIELYQKKIYYFRFIKNC